MGEGYSLFPQR